MQSAPIRPVQYSTCVREPDSITDCRLDAFLKARRRFERQDIFYCLSCEGKHPLIDLGNRERHWKQRIEMILEDYNVAVFSQKLLEKRIKKPGIANKRNVAEFRFRLRKI